MDLLRIENLKTYFYTEAGVVQAVDEITFGVREGETLGLVGESGSGKTVTVLSALRIVPRPGRIVSGRILFRGEDLLEKSEREMAAIRGKEMAIAFQDPTSSLNPVFTIGSQLTEIVRQHQKIDRKEVNDRIVDLLRLVGIPDPETRIAQYPHELSGGMRQRVALARALCCNPSLIFLDEPTTNLDVTIQAQILELIASLQRKLNMSIVLVTHDMGVIADMSKRVVVMYAGRICETASVTDLFRNPKHPYTEALLASVPRLDRGKGELLVIPGNIPNLISPPSGCRFHPRCRYAQPICEKEIPRLQQMESDHYLACLRANELFS